jgi:hypothetical protein
MPRAVLYVDLTGRLLLFAPQPRVRVPSPRLSTVGAAVDPLATPVPSSSVVNFGAAAESMHRAAAYIAQTYGGGANGPCLAFEFVVLIDGRAHFGGNNLKLSCVLGTDGLYTIPELARSYPKVMMDGPVNDLAARWAGQNRYQVQRARLLLIAARLGDGRVPVSSSAPDDAGENEAAGDPAAASGTRLLPSLFQHLCEAVRCGTPDSATLVAVNHLQNNDTLSSTRDRWFRTRCATK